MREMNERPICHRAEDLVTYLYGEANEVEALDFHQHLQQCQACHNEFAVFNQVHDSIGIWRNEALGASFNSALQTSEPVVESRRFALPERRLSAVAAIREFFKVSPLWLRGATAFAGLLFCVLVVLAISNAWRRPVQVSIANDEKKFTEAEFKAALDREMKNRTEKLQQTTATAPKEAAPIPKQSLRHEMARAQKSVKPRIKGLTIQERQQLAADLRLIPMTDDEELTFGISDQPNQ